MSNKRRATISINAEDLETLQLIRRASGLPQQKVVSLALAEWLARHCKESTIIGSAIRGLRSTPDPRSGTADQS